MALFDLLWLDGHDLCPLPLRERRRLLEDLVEPAPGGGCRPSTTTVPGCWRSREQGLEGVVSKRLDSIYLPGKRTTSWRKVKVRLHQEVVVGGWWPGTGNREGGWAA